MKDWQRFAPFVWSALLLAGAIVAVFVFRGTGTPEAANDTYEFLAPTTGRIESVVTAQGKLEPREYVAVGAQVSGQLRKIHADIGDVVQAGDLLAEIDPRVYQARVQADEARLKTLQAQLAEQDAQNVLAEQIYRRQQRLITSDAVSQEAVQIAETTLKAGLAHADSIRAQIEEARSTLDGDRTNLGYTRIYAPMAGTVVLQGAREGQTLNATQQAPTILQISNLDRMTVRAQVAEADVMRLVPGMPAYFGTLGALERRWQGAVRQVLPSPEVVNDVVLYHALVDVDNRDRQLMSGMSAQIFFVLGEADQALLLPIAALGKRLPDRDDARGTAYRVRVKGAEGLEERIVHVGLTNRTHAEVRAGLAESDEVAVPIRKQSQPAAGRRPQTYGGPRL